MRRRRKGGFGDDGFEAWGGYMAAKKAKLREQFAVVAAKETSDTHKEIFNGIAIFVNGYTEPSADQLKRLMMLYGGQYHHYMTQRTTHIIATNLPDVKVKKLKVMRVVKPDWITESIKAGKLLDYRSYLLYSNQSRTQPRLEFGLCTTASFNSSDVPQSASDEKFQDVSDGLHHNDMTSKLTCEQQDKACTSADKGPIKQCQIEYETNKGVKSSNKVDELCAIPGPSKDLPTYENILGYHAAVQSPQKQTTCVAVTVHSTTFLQSNKTAVKSLNDGAGYGPIPSSSINTSTSKNSLSDQVSMKPPQKRTSATKTANDATFLSEFYTNSRLHHISTMGAAFKQYVNELRDKSDWKFEGQEKLKDLKKMGRIPIVHPDNDVDNELEAVDTSYNKVIMHIDMDCFFVSVGLRKRPDLRGQPVAVTHSKGNPKPQQSAGSSRKQEFDCYKQRMQGRRHLPNPGEEDGTKVSSWMDLIDDNSTMSEIASCSYEARRAGVKNGMFVGQALKLCPNLKTIPYDFEGYKEVSYSLYDTVACYTLDIEAVSCDELFVDCTTLIKNTKLEPLEFATIIREEIKDKTGCSVSTGFGGNLLQARLATKRAKPDGQFHLLPAHVSTFMQNVKVDDLPGVGRSLSYRLQGLSVITCGDLQQLTLAKLQQEFGMKTGLALHQHCRGQDDRKLSLGHVRKSVSAEVNYGIRFTSQREADTFLQQLAVEVTKRLKDVNMRAHCITLKLMIRAKEAPTETAKFLGHGVCDAVSKSISLPRAVADADTIAREVISMQRQLKIAPSELRGVGIQLSRLEKEQKSTGGIMNFLKKQPNPSGVCGVVEESPDCSSSSSGEAKAPAQRASHSEEGRSHGKGAVDGGKLLSFQTQSKQVSTEDSTLVQSDKTQQTRCAIDHFMGQNNSKPDTIRDYEQAGSSREQPREEPSRPVINEPPEEADIDPEVFAALPDYIQEEILRELKKKKNVHNEPIVTRSRSQQRNVIENKLQHRKSKTKKLQKTVQFDKEQHGAGPSTSKDIVIERSVQLTTGRVQQPHVISKQVGQDHSNSTSTSASVSAPGDRNSAKLHNREKQLLEEMNCTQLQEEVGLDPNLSLTETRKLLKAWVSTEPEPQSCDVDMLARHCQQLAVTRRLEMLDLALRCLNRCINNRKNSKWEEAFRNILNKTQSVMKIIYGGELLLDSTFNVR